VFQPRDQPFKYVNLLVGRIQFYVKNSPLLFLNKEFHDKSVMPAPADEPSPYVFFHPTGLPNAEALKKLSEWINQYNALPDYITLESLIEEGEVSAESLGKCLRALRKAGIATSDDAGLKMSNKQMRKARLSSSSSESGVTKQSAAELWVKLEDVLKRVPSLVDYKKMLAESPVLTNVHDGFVDVSSLARFIELVNKRLRPLHDGVAEKCRWLASFIKECGAHGESAAASLAKQEHGQVFIMLLTCAAELDEVMRREKTEEQARQKLSKLLPSQELEIDLGGKVTYRDKRLYVSVGEVKSYSKGRWSEERS